MNAYPDFYTTEIREIFARFRQAGKAVYVVGGAVRDHVLGRPIHDVDMTTEATPEEVLALFPDYTAIEVGRAFGTIALVTPVGHVEITTFREDQTYSDGRHPDGVVFAKTLEEDLSRRDFTVNAMAYRPEDGVVDLFGGQEDAKERRIRAVGDPRERIREDALRMLRAVRFAHRLDFAVDDALASAIRENRRHIHLVSQERITQELFHMFTADAPSKAIRLLDEVGLLEEVLPVVYRMKDFDQKTPFHHLDLLGHTLLTMDQTPPKLRVRIAALLHDVGKLDTQSFSENGQAHYYGHDQRSVDMAKEIMRGWKASNDLISDVTTLIGRHMEGMNPYTKKSIKRLMGRTGELVWDLFDLQEADILSTKGQMGYENLALGRSLAQGILEEGAVTNQKGLTINGSDLIEIGYQQGKSVGVALAKLTELVMDEELPNERGPLLERARTWLIN